MDKKSRGSDLVNQNGDPKLNPKNSNVSIFNFFYFSSIRAG